MIEEMTGGITTFLLHLSTTTELVQATLAQGHRYRRQKTFN
jgi:hypothetical protein